MARGSVKQRGKQWYIVYPYTTPEGKYKRRWERAVAVGFPNTLRGAEQALRQRLSEVDAGRPVHAGALTLAAYITTWQAGRHHVRPATRYNDNKLIKNHIVPHLGDVPLAKLRRSDVRAWHTTLLETLAPGSIARVHQSLTTVLNEAVRDGLLRENVARHVRPPRRERVPPVVWEPAQVERFMAHCADDPYGALWMVLLLTGLRRGEILALRWADIDLPNARLTVRQTLTSDDQGRHAFGPPKTRSSLRTVEFPAAVSQALRAQRDRQLFQRDRAGRAWQETGLVFTKADGTMLRPTTLVSALRMACDRAGVPRLTMHGLRHTHATWLMAGVHPKVVSERLGHSRTAITLDLYSHVTPTMQRDAADWLDRALSTDDSKSDSSDSFPAAES